MSNAFNRRTKCVRREASSIGEFNQAITIIEWNTTERSRAGCKLDIFELGAACECSIVNSFEVFVADNALEGRAKAESHLFDDCELIGEGDTLEGGTVLESVIADSLEVFVADDAFEGRTFAESRPLDNFELIGESNTREGDASLECVFS